MNFAYYGPANTKEEALRRLLEDYHPFVAIDTETIGLKGEKSVPWVEYNPDGYELDIEQVPVEATTCIGVGVATGPYEAYYFPVSHNDAWVNVPLVDLSPLVQLLESQVHIFFFNSIFDLDRIEEALNINCDSHFGDVAIACQVQGLWNSLEANAGHLLGEDHQVISDILPKGKTMLDVDFRVTANKCMQDCLTTWRLADRMDLMYWQRGHDFEWTDHVGRSFDVTDKIVDCYEVDRALIPLLRKMGKRGVSIRPDFVSTWNDKLSREIRSYDQFFRQEGVNVASNDQVGRLLLDRGNFIPLTESRKHLKVNEEILRQVALKDPLAYMVLSRRRRAKLKNTYIDPMLNKTWARTHWRLDLATGRLGSYAFNAQNQPPSMRGMFDPSLEGVDFLRPNVNWSWMDLHQAEMRVWANQAKDEVMLDAFKTGSSPHVTTLNYLFPGVAKSNPDGSSTPQYVDSKSFNFALLADASVPVLARTTKRPEAQVAKLKAEMYELYWRTVEHQNQMRQYQGRRGYLYPEYVESDFGRRCHIPDDILADDMHKSKCRLNWPFQSSVADVIKRIMLGLDGQGFDLTFQVHDELVVAGDVEFPQWCSEVHPEIPMPFETSHAPVWA